MPDSHVDPLVGSSPSKSKALAVFAKRPVPGRVKTRLTPSLGPERAAELSWAMTQDVWQALGELRDVELFLFVDEPWEGFSNLAGESRIRIQREGDLGQRMYSCFQLLKSYSFNSLMILGSDSPATPIAHLDTAFELLSKENDAVLGPTEDGGYYLVGCRQAKPGMFDGVPWSSAQTFEKTRESFVASGYEVRLAPSGWDVDVPEDLHRLRRCAAGGHVRGWFQDQAGRGRGEAPST